MCMRMLRARLLATSIVFAMALVVGASAQADTYTAAALTNVSGSSPFGAFASCNGGPLDAPLFVNSEVEPWIAVNPANTSNAIAVFQQDRWQNGGSRGLVGAATTGAGWSKSFAPFTFCSGGTTANGGDFERASDPWVTFSPNGAAYQISLSFDESSLDNAVLVSKSSNGGATWGAPTTLKRDSGERETSFAFNDKESITADSTNSSYAYAIWDRLVSPTGTSNASVTGFENAVGFRGPIWFSRTTDGGATWERARQIYDPGQINQTIGNQIVVLPNGDLVDVFDLISNASNTHGQRGLNVAVIRSSDKGATWSKPTIVAKLNTVGVTDPDNGHGVRTGDIIPDIAVDALSGKLYVVWQDARFSGGQHDDIAFSSSSNGGLTWSMPIKVNQTPVPAAAFTAGVDVAADHAVGVTYYDFRANDASPGLPTDYFLVHSHDGGVSWDPETRITPTSFDMESAPDAAGYFVGDYEGLTHVGNRFMPLFVQSVVSGAAQPTSPVVDTTNRTDAFVTTVGP
jgi:BNR repeat-like domain